ncbi:S41 family peptidase [Alteromonas genovensis]|uniref:S41 family peptidase n=1 Tax=Alteromonas genovensis TaxID=471225 RepID=UPI002FDFEA1E
MTADDELLSQQEVVKALNNLVVSVDKDYLHEKHREKMTEQITTSLNQGDFDGYYQFHRFKRKLESLLYASSHDANFEITWRSESENLGNAPDRVFPSTIETQLLESNIGYLGIDGDLIGGYLIDGAPIDEHVLSDIDNAVAYLSSATALIIDLRSAGYVDLDVAKQFLSYFVPTGKPLATLTLAHNNTSLLVASDTGFKMGEKVPIFVVTSPFVAGSWEFVAYTLQQTSKATVVGTRTMGLSYLSTTTPLSEHINLVMTYGDLRHPFTQESWKDEGVIPDIPCDATDAVTAAFELVEKRLNSETKGK